MPPKAEPGMAQAPEKAPDIPQPRMPLHE